MWRSFHSKKGCSEIEYDFKFNTTDSSDAKLVIDSVDELLFDIHARGKTVGDRRCTKDRFLEKALLASELGGSKSHESIPREASVFQRVTFFPKFQR